VALPTPEQALAGLAAHDRPRLIGVRHHSPACAAAVPALLDAWKPRRVLVELPAELEEWLPWLGHPELVAPVALSAQAAGQEGLGFYPFADFSPELAAVRWARANGAALEAIDLPFGRRGEDHGKVPALEPDGPPGRIQRAMADAVGATDPGDLWDRLVEAHALGAAPEEVRRAALLYGWALRADVRLSAAPEVEDLARERHMRERIGEGGDAVAVIGSFHAAALADPALDPLPRLGAAKKRRKKEPPVRTALLPYAFELLDSRSGYPAGIRDPRWQQRVWEAARDASPADRAAAEALVALCREIRADRHPAGVPDAEEGLRVALDLARLRGLPGPGRAELLEAIATTLGHGEAQGRGRIVARAMRGVLIGDARGQLAPGTPRSGLGPHVEELLAAMKLPGPGQRSRRAEIVQLDPLRSDLDRRRHVALHRLSAAGVEYAEPIPPADDDEERLGRAWQVRWTPRTDADLEIASARGVTLEMAAAGAIRLRLADLEATDQLSPAVQLDVLEVAAECGLGAIVDERLSSLAGAFLGEATLADIVRALAIAERMAHGHVPGLPIEGSSPRAIGAVRAWRFPEDFPRDDLLSAGVHALEGLSGSDSLDDARAMIALVRLLQGTDLGEGRLGWALDGLAEAGSPLMQGAAGIARVLSGRDDAAAFGARIASWLDADPGAGLARRLAGLLVVAGAAFEAHPGLTGPLVARVGEIPDAAFLERLPALRDGFEVLSPAARGRLLETLDELLPGGGRLDALAIPAARLATFAAADRAAAAAIARLGLRIPAPQPSPEAPVTVVPPRTDVAIGPRDRWRLILGRERDELPPESEPYAVVLDELYGAGQGEGSHGDLGGDDTPFPTAREWAVELDALFGGRVRDEVLARAVERGRSDVVGAIDPEQVVPSVDLLRRILSARGSIAEEDLGPVRRLVARIVDELVRDLARAVQPALGGLDLPRPTRRPTGRVDLRRTLAASLRTARPGSGGEAVVVPERLVFRSRSRRALDWHVVLLVDVSGSMEASALHAAMMASILAGLPAVSVRFLAFSDDVIDLSEHVADPLELLLSVEIGGGTNIGKALAYARQAIEVPGRTLVVVVSDFEEGYSVPRLLAEVRALVESGVKPLGLAALDDDAQPRYVAGVAESVAEAGMPVAALSPLELARWVAEHLK
jgi:hypothetical protein